MKTIIKMIGGAPQGLKTVKSTVTTKLMDKCDNDPLEFKNLGPVKINSDYNLLNVGSKRSNGTPSLECENMEQCEKPATRSNCFIDRNVRNRPQNNIGDHWETSGAVGNIILYSATSILNLVTRKGP